MARNTLCTLPLAKKKQQKVAVGDDSGVVTVFYMKKGETQIEWQSSNLGREITKVCLQHGRDKIFVACGQSIQGFTRKGKEFLKIRTNLTETIHQLFADDTTIWTCGEYIMNTYENCKDAGFLMTPDKINDLICAPVSNDPCLSSIMAFQDKHIRVYSGERLVHDYQTTSAVTALGFYDRAEVENRTAGSKKEVYTLFGTESGNVQLLSLDSDGVRDVFSLSPYYRSEEERMRGVTGPNSTSTSTGPMYQSGNTTSNNKQRQSAVTHVVTADIGRSGILDLCIGREDGTVEIWNLSTGGQNDPNELGNASVSPPRLMFDSCLGESVRSLDVGTVSLGEQGKIVNTIENLIILSFTLDTNSSAEALLNLTQTSKLTIVAKLSIMLYNVRTDYGI